MDNLTTHSAAPRYEAVAPDEAKALKGRLKATLNKPLAALASVDLGGLRRCKSSP